MSEILKKKILELYDTFSGREQCVAKYVVDNYTMISSMSTSEVAKNAAVSTATVVRFTKSLGFSGFMQFKAALKEEVLPTRSPYNLLKNMEPSNDLEHFFRYAQMLGKDIAAFIEKLDFKVLDELVDLTLKADIVYLVGIGSDKVIAEYLINYLALLGIRCVTITEEGIALKEKLLSLRSKDLLIMSSFPTVQKDEYWVAKYANEKHTPVALLSNSSIIAKSFKAKFYFDTGTTQQTFYNSNVVSLFFCDILLWRLYDRDRARAEQALKAYHDIVTNSK